MVNKLLQRYNEVTVELKATQTVMAAQTGNENVRQKVTALKAEQDNLQKTLHFIALFHLRDEAWRTLSH